MMLQEKPRTLEKDGKHRTPVESHGVKLLSIGFFARPIRPSPGVGPWASKAPEQLFKMPTGVNWTCCSWTFRRAPRHLPWCRRALTGAIIVSAAARGLADALGRGALPPAQRERARARHRGEHGVVHPGGTAGEPLLHLRAWRCRALALDELKVPFLAEVPLVQSIREAGDAGRPAVLQGDTPQAGYSPTFAGRWPNAWSNPSPPEPC